MVKRLFQRLWNDDLGALIAIELLFIATILIIGIIAGLSSLRSAVNIELSELANAILALSQGFVISGQSGCSAFSEGSQAIDTPGLVPPVVCLPPAIPSVIDVTPCN